MTTPLLAPGYRGATVGSVALVFLAAFEALAVTTVMPVVTADLDARAWYSVAFSATLGASVVGMVATGLWSDRAGPVRPLLSAVGVFAAGLLLAGAANGVALLVAGRFLQGLGGGGLSVALYVLVGRVYAPADRARVLGLFAAAWVLPGLVGPFLAGVVAETLGWRWVFLGVVALAGGALALMVPSLRALHEPSRPSTGEAGGVRRLLLAAAVAGAVVVLNLTGGLGGGAGLALAGLATVAALVAVAPLLPPGTLRLAPGLPAVVATRGLVGGTFFAAEVYLPYLLQEQYDVGVSRSGLVLTAATLGWAAASHVQGRLGESMADTTALRVGSSVELGGVVLVAGATALGAPALVVGLGWFVTATGIGFAYPRTTAAVLARSEPGERGRHSAALTIADAVCAAIAVALVGVLFTALGSAAEVGAFVAAFACAAGVGLLAVYAARRA